MAEANKSEIVASHVSHEIRVDAANPAAEWQRAQPIRFSADWQGRNPDPALETEVRVLWSPRTLYLRFVCNYRELFVFQNSDPNGRRDHLWDRDVAEAFLQPEPSPERYYKEFEIAPNGMWIDLDISPSGLADLKSGLTRSVHVDEEKHIWRAEMAIPVESITKQFDPNSIWRANFYRIEGAEEPRRYMAWQPTHTPQPSFHVPEAFGTMRFKTA
jgi:alpha-galactosidase